MSSDKERLEECLFNLNELKVFRKCVNDCFYTEYENGHIIEKKLCANLTNDNSSSGYYTLFLNDGNDNIERHKFNTINEIIAFLENYFSKKGNCLEDYGFEYDNTETEYIFDNNISVFRLVDKDDNEYGLAVSEDNEITDFDNVDELIVYIENKYN